MIDVSVRAAQDVGELLTAPAQRLGRLPTCGHVAHDRREEGVTAGDLELGDGDLGRELGAVPAVPDDLGPVAVHAAADVGIGAELVDQLVVDAPVSGWEQHAERPADHVGGGTAEHLLGGLVEHDDVLLARRARGSRRSALSRMPWKRAGELRHLLFSHDAVGHVARVGDDAARRWGRRTGR